MPRAARCCRQKRRSRAALSAAGRAHPGSWHGTACACAHRKAHGMRVRLSSQGMAAHHQAERHAKGCKAGRKRTCGCCPCSRMCQAQNWRRPAVLGAARRAQPGCPHGAPSGCARDTTRRPAKSASVSAEKERGRVEDGRLRACVAAGRHAGTDLQAVERHVQRAVRPAAAGRGLRRLAAARVRAGGGRDERLQALRARQRERQAHGLDAARRRKPGCRTGGPAEASAPCSAGGPCRSGRAGRRRRRRRGGQTCCSRPPGTAGGRACGPAHAHRRRVPASTSCPMASAGWTQRRRSVQGA